MKIIYNDTKKDLPCNQLHNLFTLVGWSKGEENSEHLANFNIGFINSTLVISAWYNNQLVGAVRVISDCIFRSVIYDLVVHPQYQNKGIGSDLVKRCFQHFPKSEWLVQTQPHTVGYYKKKLGFNIYEDVVLSIPCKLFSVE